MLGQARDLGFLGVGPVEDHVEHALGFARVLREHGAGDPEVAVDLGTGGGVPGLVLASIMVDTRWVFVDAMLKRTAFLATAVQALQLDDRVEVRTARAEDVGRGARAFADVVVARSFGPPAVLAECAAPLLEVGGTLVVSEPPGGDAGRWPAADVAQLGLSLRAIVAGPPAFAVLQQVALAPAGVPRRAGLPAKRPRW